jgi:serine/threonine protein kinase
MASTAGSAGASLPSSKPADGAPENTPSPCKKIGKYELQKKIGAGGMGAVFLAVDPALKRQCALKVLPPDKAKNPTLVKRFKAEAQAAATLRHENIVNIYEADDADGYSYIALEYVDGTDVAKLVEQRGPIPLKRSIEMIRQVARALEHAALQGIVHRDIKPGNLLVRRDGVVKLTDLGLARIVDDNTDTSITRAGTTVGTVDFMSPEQARDSKAADVRSDIYSLGCTWYFMLTGHPPFPEGSLTNKLRAHAETPVPDPRDENPTISEAVFGVIRRMMEKKPSRRYQTPGDLIEDLNATSLTSDIVSQTILDDLPTEVEVPVDKSRRRAATKAKDDGASFDEGPALPAARKSRPAVSESATPAFKPPPRKSLADVPENAPARNSAAIFYAIVGVVLIAIAATIISLVKNYGAALDTSGQSAPPGTFVDRQAKINEAGGATSGGKAAGRNPATSKNADDPKPKGADEPSTAGDAGNSVGGNQSPTVVPGTARRRIGGDEDPNAVPDPAAGAARARQESAVLPDWAVQPRPTDALPRLIVRPGASGSGASDPGRSAAKQFASLNEALDHVPQGGAVIQLAGNGPFPLAPVKVADRTRVVIEPLEPAGRSSLPLVVLVPPNEGAAANLIEFANTTVDFRRIHIALDAVGLSTDPDDALLSAIGSDVYLLNCSLSVKGTRNPPMTAVKISGKTNRGDGSTAPQTRVLVENTSLRGNALTGVLVNCEHLDLALRNSLLWSGVAASVRFAPLARSDAESGRSLRIVSSTLCSQNCAVQMGGDASHPVHTSLAFLNSLVAAPAGGNSPALFDLIGWNQAQQKAALGKFITWKSTDSLYTGWTTLVQLNPGAVRTAKSPSEWQTVWKDKDAPNKNQFQPEHWPTQPAPDIAAVALDALAPQTGGKQHIKTADGGWPGCQTASLAGVNLEALTALSNSSSHPDIPRGMLGFASRGQTIRVDVMKEDLGKFLERQKLQNGTEIIVSGAGNRVSSPIVIENAWVRMTFAQADGPPLVLSPRPAETGHDGFISVVNGGIELVGCAFSIPASEKQALPKWFIEVIDGDLALRHCRIHGPLVGTTRNKGLIQWKRESGRPPARMFEGDFEGYAAIVDCFLIGSGTLLEADMHRRALFIRNSIAVSRDDLLELSVAGQDSQIGGVVDLDYSTFSAVDRIVHVEGAELGSPTNSPLAIFADRCVFAPPLRGQQRATPTLFSYSGHVLEQRQVAWFENRCGYSADIMSFLRPDSDPASVAAQNFEQVWVGQWGGDGQVVEPLVGVKGVVLKAELPTRAEDRQKLGPGDFELHSSSKATAWDGAGQPIGANVAKMKLPRFKASGGSSSSKPKATKEPAPPPPPTGF